MCLLKGWQFSRYPKCQKLVDQNCTVLPSFPAGVMEVGPSTVQGHFCKPGSRYRAHQEHHQAHKAYVQEAESTPSLQSTPSTKGILNTLSTSKQTTPITQSVSGTPSTPSTRSILSTQSTPITLRQEQQAHRVYTYPPAQCSVNKP